MVVRVHLLRADGAAEDLDRPVGEHLVDVHVGRGGRAGLEDVERELAVELAVDHFLGRLPDGPRDLAGHHAQLLVDRRRLGLDHRHRRDEPLRQRQPRDGEVPARPLRLRAVVRPGRHFDLAEAVFFDSRIRHESLLIHRKRMGLGARAVSYRRAAAGGQELQRTSMRAE